MRFLSLALGLLLLTGCKKEKPMPESENAVTAFALQHFVDGDEITGAVTAVVGPDGLIAVEAFGLADVAGKRSMGKDSMFWIASMTKPMTAMAVMMLVEEGKVKLDDPLEQYVPAFKGIPLKTAQGLVAPQRRITVKDLLTHVSGIDTATVTPPGAPVDTVPFAEMCDAYARKPLVTEPGAKWTYNNNGINLLGRIIEVASGKPYADFMQERLFDPLGMENTTFWPTPDHMDVLAKPYAKDKASGALVEAKNSRFSTPLHDPKRTPFPAGGLYSCARDLGQLYQMLLNDGELDGKRYLKAATLKQMTTNQLGDLKGVSFAPGMRMGLGFHLVGEPQEVTESLSPGTYGHGGAFGTQAWIDPVKKRAYVLLIQRTDLKNSDGSDIRREFQRAAREAYAK
ncbi:MAG: beta-lactamase family protein [Verrucomicrobia bacterium]|nr:beta-lactamase family protein [Verrucomicrobiota bacterium]